MAEDGLLSETEAALVFRRAAELEAADPGGQGGGFDLAALERIGAEAGLSPAAVRRAVAELRAGRLDTTAPAALTSVPRRAVVERTVPVPEDVAAKRLEMFLRSQVLRVCRRRGTLTVWEPARGLGANLMRGIDLTDRMRLGRVDGVELLIEPTDDGTTFVRVTLDLARMHRNVVSGRLAAAGMGVAGLAAGLGGLLLGAPEALLVLPAAGGGAAGTFFGTRSTYAKHLKKAVDAVELVLDELEHQPRRSLR